jgi:hypothetical protein
VDACERPLASWLGPPPSKVAVDSAERQSPGQYAVVGAYGLRFGHRVGDFTRPAPRGKRASADERFRTPATPALARASATPRSRGSTIRCDRSPTGAVAPRITMPAAEAVPQAAARSPRTRRAGAARSGGEQPHRRPRRHPSEGLDPRPPDGPAELTCVQLDRAAPLAPDARFWRWLSGKGVTSGGFKTIQSCHRISSLATGGRRC